jgi:predicted DCC family thiol-disulfide oxidoreductase YuxK
MSELNTQDTPVILFDGLCNLCNSSVQFILKRDRKKQFRYASMQGVTGRLLLQRFNLSGNSSFFLLKQDKIYTQSDAALKVAKELSGLWPLCYLFIVVPPFIRDSVYRFIASHRYHWFGKKEQCEVPSAAVKNYFLDTQ